MAEPTSERPPTAVHWCVSPVVLGLWLGVVSGYLYVDLISQPNLENRRKLLPEILQHQAKSDYLYATYTLAQAHEFLATHTPLSDARVFALIDFVGVFLLFVCAGIFLQITFDDLASRLSGLLWLAATSPLLLFRMHFYHPSDFYATALVCLILLAARRGRFLWVAALCLIAGALWEKTLFVPFIYYFWEAGRVGVARAGLRAAPALAATLFWFAFWRITFPEQTRVHAYEDWLAFLHTLPAAAVEWLVWIGPILLVLADIVIARRRIDRFWLCWLLYVPLLLAVIIAVRGHVRELRSFWICQPILAGLIAEWVARVQSDNVPTN
jgi:hypothetical protein